MLQSRFPLLLFVLFFFCTGCTEVFERSGIVVEEESNAPLEGVSIELYLKEQKGDSLTSKVFTDNNGHFYISETHNKDRLFQLSKPGFIDYVGTLSANNDTIKLERTN